MINKVVLIGRLGADPELRYTQQGTAVASFNIAVNRRTKKQDGSRETDWITIVAWQQQAELCAQYLKKGSQIAVEGRIQTGSYENKDGQRVRTFEVVAENVQFLDRAGDGEQGSSGPRSFQSQGQDNTNRSSNKDPFANNDKVIDISDDDLPF
ncbi:single-stranded DNA-binding protein [Desulfuribacillus alkaliarsenatis]|uniref:Single-stranded DNA-binding protein n=1 Tax=Desulfuribacillus alkaliarsenatis TaxID=766136 RepID=A0A1E5G2Y0_9FIRM|nr:single-stranded DNA-binding protein [Desulfuribacillus alkaliarsenatis]OEF97334.1 single-stranded DNA-binding protein [Desulfuribacillus alkaliarsenatis]